MKAFAKCGMRCDLCLIYRPNVEREDRRHEICAVWKKQNLNFNGDPETMICDGCACEGEDAVLFDRNCRTRKCVLEKGYEHCGFCESYPCDIFPAEPSPEEIARMIDVEKLWTWEDEKLMEAYACKRYMDEFRAKHMLCHTIQEERLSPSDYIEFLKETDLGSQYPKERFEERIAVLVKSVPISLTARGRDGRLIGVCFGITDFAYWLFITDLGVARDCTGRGIGRALVKAAHELAGGEKDIVMYTCANENAVPFYEKLGMKRPKDVMVYDNIDWTEFTVK